jgi:asparagine synthase (glutamine-hydrolysing)
MVYRAFHVEPESYLERQPYVSARGNWMTWDGRLDNRDELLLLVKDHLQDDTTDVALAMAAYEKWGEPGFNRLIGDWSLALWDAASDSIILTNDYLGSRPLYYYADDKCIAWSSDLGMLASWVGAESDLDNHYIAAFLTASPTYDRTVYRFISFVPCAHLVRAKDTNVTKAPFWFSPVENRIRYRDERDYEEHLLHLFRESVLHRLRTNHGVCCDLSGGLDSSSVTCMARHLIESGATSSKPLATFSLMDPDMDDIKYIEIVEQYCLTDPIHLPYTKLWSLDVPSSPMPARSDLLRLDPGQALQNKHVRSHLTGSAGDTVMGNFLDDTDQLADSFQQGAWVRLFKETYAWSRVLRIPFWLTLTLGTIPLRSAVKQQKLWKMKAGLLQETYGDLEKISPLNQQFVDRYLDKSAPPENLSYRKAIPSKRGFLNGIREYQISHRQTIRLHQFEPIKSTHPYCHRPLVEFVAAIPSQQLCQAGRPRSLMRRAFSGILPPAVLERRTKALANSAADKSLLDILPALCSSELQTQSRGYVDGSTFRRILQNPQAMDYNKTHLRSALILEIWLRTSRSPAINHPGSESKYSGDLQLERR